MKSFFNKKRIPLLVSVAIGLLSLAYYLSYYKYLKIDVDEGLLINGAMRVLSGQLPLKDFPIYLPGRFYLLGLWFLVFGKTVAAERLLFVGIHCLKNILGYHVARKIMPMPFSLIPAVLLALIPGFWTKAFVNLILLVNISFIMRYFRNPRRINLYLMGVAVGFAFYFREDMTGYCFITVCLMLLITGVREKERIGAIISRGVAFSSFAFLTILPLLILYLVGSGLPGFINGIFITVGLGHTESSAFRAPLFFLKGLPKITDTALGLIFPYFAILLFMVTGIRLVWSWLSKREAERKDEILVLAVLILAILAFTHIWHWTHEFRIPQSGALIHVLWAYLVYSAYSGFRSSLQKKGGGVKAAMLIVVILGALGIQIFLVYYSFSGHSMVRYDGGGISLKKGPHREIKHTDRSGILPPAAQAVTYNQILMYLQKYTAEKDRILCFGESPLYFLSKRENATAYDNGRIPAYFPKERKKFIHQIKTEKPKIIVLRNWEYGFWYPKMPEVFDYITSAYFPDRRIHGFHLFSLLQNQNSHTRQGNSFYWKGNFEKAAAEYLKALETRKKDPELQKILNRIFSSQALSGKTLPVLDGYYIGRAKNAWRLRWGSRKQTRFSGVIRLSGERDLQTIIPAVRVYPEKSSSVVVSRFEDRIEFVSEISDEAAGLDLVFSSSHPALSFQIDLNQQDNKAPRAIVYGKGLLHLGRTLILKKNAK